MEILTAECENSPGCAGVRHHFEECQERVTEGKGFEGENCIEELCVFVLTAAVCYSLTCPPCTLRPGVRCAVRRSKTNQEDLCATRLIYLTSIEQVSIRHAISRLCHQLVLMPCLHLARTTLRRGRLFFESCNVQHWSGYNAPLLPRMNASP